MVLEIQFGSVNYALVVRIFKISSKASRGASGVQGESSIYVTVLKVIKTF